MRMRDGREVVTDRYDPGLLYNVYVSGRGALTAPSQTLLAKLGVADDLLGQAERILVALRAQRGGEGQIADMVDLARVEADIRMADEIAGGIVSHVRRGGEG